MLIPDNETAVDFLNCEAISGTVIELLNSNRTRALTIGVHGDWGAGKSSVLEMIEATLDSQDRVLCLKFNGWRFQGFEDAKIALIEGIVTGPGWPVASRQIEQDRLAVANHVTIVGQHRDLLQRIDATEGGLAIGALRDIDEHAFVREAEHRQKEPHLVTVPGQRMVVERQHRQLPLRGQQICPVDNMIGL